MSNRKIATQTNVTATPIYATKHVFVRINGLPIATRTPFDNPLPHSDLDLSPTHLTPNLTPSHLQCVVRINSDRVSLDSDPASCGHTIEAGGFPVIYSSSVGIYKSENEYPE